MLSLTIYTPGLNPYTDTLIMWGLISPLCYKEVDFEVHGVCGSYKIEIKNISLDDYINIVNNYVKNNVNTIIQRLTQDPILVQPQLRRTLNSILELLTKPIVKNYINDLQTPGHAIRSNAGRGSKSKGRTTLWIGLGPFLGKWFYKYFHASAQTFNVCRFCVGFAAMGLAIGSIGFGRREARAFVLTFDGKVNRNALCPFINEINTNRDNLIEILRRVADNIPLAVLSKLFIIRLSPNTIRKLYNVNACWKVYSVNITKAATQLRGFCEIDVNPLLDGCAIISQKDSFAYDRLIDAIDELTRIILSKMRGRIKGIAADVDALDAIFNAFYQRTPVSVYKAMRLLYHTFLSPPGKCVARALSLLLA